VQVCVNSEQWRFCSVQEGVLAGSSYDIVSDFFFFF